MTDQSDAGSAGIFCVRRAEICVRTDRSNAESAGIFSRRTNQTQEARVYSHDGPIRRRKRGYILTMDQSEAGSAGSLSQRTNLTQEARVYSHDGPIRRINRGYILTMDRSDAGSAGIFCARRAEVCVRGACDHELLRVNRPIGRELAACHSCDNDHDDDDDDDADGDDDDDDDDDGDDDDDDETVTMMRMAMTKMMTMATTMMMMVMMMAMTKDDDDDGDAPAPAPHAGRGGATVGGWHPTTVGLDTETVEKSTVKTLSSRVVAAESSILPSLRYGRVICTSRPPLDPLRTPSGPPPEYRFVTDAVYVKLRSRLSASQ
eukprot:1177242-Prorocentrum_minimum.AAC.1